MKIGFVINPIAGMGGRVGLKGTDGVYEEALRRGAQPVTPRRAREFLSALHEGEFEFLTASGNMGAALLSEFSYPYLIVYECGNNTTSEDTKRACAAFLEHGASLIVFVGGDGTARDVVSVVDSRVPILGVPGGVKMYSSVFCITPDKCAKVLESFASGAARIKDAEVLDIDESAYRQNQLRIKLYGVAKVPYVADIIQNSKSEYGHSDGEEKEAIAEFFAENIEPDTLYLIGAGTTTAKIAEKLGVRKTLLGVDAIYNGQLIARDLNERDMLTLLDKYKKAKIVVSPIGAQGFVFGRGNQQFSPAVLARVGRDNIIIVATPTKLKDITKLRVDIENAQMLKGYYRVLVGYGKYKMMKME
ncbi:MAG: ATP-NAD kinase family protein [Euryarchaeota archaeon]|nr:ATP-NAD kinase family protein [Euryarchaeota archaeon]